MAPPDSFDIRAMVAADLPVAVELWLRTEGVGRSPDETPERLVSFLERNPGISSVAIARAGRLAGALLGGHDGRRGYLYHLAVDGAFRGRGIGRALVDRVTMELSIRGIARATVMVFADNPEGRAFWAHLGWHGRDDLGLMQRWL